MNFFSSDLRSPFLNLLFNHALLLSSLWLWICKCELFTENKNLMLVWTSASKCYRDLARTFQKRVCEAVGPALADLPKPLAHQSM